MVGGITFEVPRGVVTGVAGESGSGKTTAALASIGYVPAGSRRLGGTALLDGMDLLQLSPEARRKVWATRVSYVAQDAVNAFNPTMRVGAQFREVLGINRHLSASAARAKSRDLLEAVHIPDPEVALKKYPHQFSGGQLQRMAIALAIACDPELIILDEPTTGLDVIHQAGIVSLLAELIKERNLAAIYVSHDLALLEAISENIVILYAGEVVESGPASQVLRSPRHPYTRALLDSLPSIDEALRPRGIPGLPPGHVLPDRCSFARRCPFAEDRCRNAKPELTSVGPSRLVRCVRTDELGVLATTAPRPGEPESIGRKGEPVLTVDSLVCVYGGGRDKLTAVDNVSLEVRSGEVVALVGESGSGKSTIGRAITGIVRPYSGRMVLMGQPLKLDGGRTRQQHRWVQIIFQNPDSSLNPRRTVYQLILRSVQMFRDDVRKNEWRDLVASAMHDVQLDAAMMDRYPHQLSGGQKQRVAIARAFVANPKLIICDEIISGQDVSVQAAILDVVRALQTSRGTALLFISHDLAAVRSIAQWIYVIQGGRIQETGPTPQVFGHPSADYTRELLAAAKHSITDF
ncbi:MAG TPA: ABC transporter ATP-binding protein [Candidatus Dormibacteraeota bacterium]